MATITPTNLREKQQDSAFYLSVFQPVTLLTASVDNGSIARGARTIAYDGGSGSGFATIEAFQLMEVDTATGTQLVRLKSIAGNQSAGTITIDENDINFADNQTIRVKHFYPLVAIPPSIRSQVFYKFFDVTYSNQNSLVNPVAIIGSHLVGVLSSGSVAFALNSSSSYAIAQGATIASRVWSCVHNGGGTTGVSFSSTVAANPTLTITVADQYWLKCVVTDSNGKTQTTYRAIFVYADVKDAYKDFTVSTLTGDWMQSGWQFGVTATGDVTLVDFPDGTLAVLWYVNKFNGVDGYIDLWGTASQQIVCAGYLRRDQDVDDFSNGTGRVSFSVTTPDSLMDNMSEMGSISLNAVASPSKWYQYASWLTIGRGIHHLLKWHSSVLETVDVLGLTDNVLGVKNIDFTESTVLQMANTLGYSRGHFAKLVSNRLGQLYFVTDSQMLNDAGRAALDTVFSIATADVSGTVDVVRQPEASVSLADLDGFSFNGTTSTPFISITPGYRENSISYGLPGYRGSGVSSTKGQVLDDQTDSNEKIGRVFAAANNNPQELRITTPSNYLGAFDIVPSIGWYQWGITDSDLKRNIELNGRLFICRNVTHQINHAAGTIQTSVVLEPEAEGPNGIAGNYPTSYPTAGPPRSPDWDDSGAAMSAVFIASGWSDAGPVNSKMIAGKINSFDIGGEFTFANDAAQVRVCGLAPLLGMIIYFDNDTSLPMAATVTVSPPTTVFTNAAVQIDISGFTFSVSRISDTAAIAVYDINAVILSVSGTTVTVETPLALTSTLSETQAIGINGHAICLTFGVGASIQAAFLTIVGTTITQGSFSNVSSVDNSNSPISAAMLNSQTIVVTYRSNITNKARAVLLYNVGGGVFSVGDDIVIDDMVGTNPTICRIDNNRALVVYAQTSSEYVGAILTVSGANMTAGAINSVKTLSPAMAFGLNIGAAALSTTRAAVVYTWYDGADMHVATRSLTLSGTTFTDNNDEIAVNNAIEPATVSSHPIVAAVLQ